MSVATHRRAFRSEQFRPWRVRCPVPRAVTSAVLPARTFVCVTPNAPSCLWSLEAGAGRLPQLPEQGASGPQQILVLQVTPETIGKWPFFQ